MAVIPQQPKHPLELLQNLFEYNPDTGFVYWAVQHGLKIKPSTKAGFIDNEGYVRIAYRRKNYKAHHIAFLKMTGKWPDQMVDHINGEKSDNRWENLRLVTNDGNQRNQRKAHVDSKTGLIGASPFRNKFSANISINGKRICLGRYATAEEAHQVYVEAKRRHHPENTL
jgi:HNH endonuclease